MDRTFYYVGIAFFGMINGLFNPTWVLFSVIHVQILAPALLFGSVPLTLMFASLMVSTATIIVGGIPAAITSMTGLIRSGLRRYKGSPAFTYPLIKWLRSSSLRNG
jgi:hypothetical protein